MAATAAAIIATIIQATWSWVRNKKIEKMMMINLGIIIVLGGATLALRDETFIKWKLIPNTPWQHTICIMKKIIFNLDFPILTKSYK